MPLRQRVRWGTEVVILALLISCSKLQAQVAQAELAGEVRDPSAAVVASAKVTMTENQTNQTFLLTTDRAGVFDFTTLMPGAYTLTVEAPGFKRFVREGIHVATGELLRLDVTLEIGNDNEVITVNEDASLLRTESGTLGQPISNRKIVSLPLNGRNYIPLVALVPGVALPPGSSFPRINGGRPRVNEYLYDGISVLQPEPGQVAFFPVVDAIQDFNVVTNSPPAEFGRCNGGVINLSTKSGTNAFHGSIFEFFRNEALNARNLFAPASASNPNKPRFRRSQFGFVFGGPITPDKTFFFWDYQGTRQDIGRVRISTVPTLLQRQGIFTQPIAGSIPKIYDPATTAAKPGGGFTRQPFANNRIPQDRIDPVALTLLQRYPLPTSGGTANNYRRVDNEGDSQDQMDFRVDHRFTENDQMFARFSYASDVASPVTPLPDGSGVISSGVLALTKTPSYSLALHSLHSFDAGFFNEIRFGYTRRSIDRRALLLNIPPSESLGLPGIPTNSAFETELPTFLIDGEQQVGPAPNTDSVFRTDVTQLTDTVSFLKGRHSLKAGLDFRWERLDVVQPPSPTGQFRFSTLFTDLPGTTGTGNALASFLLGQVQTFSIDLQNSVLRPRAAIQEYFIQDDWKVNQRLTVNAGLRYTLNFPSTEFDNQGAVFDLGTQQLDYLGQDGISRSARELQKHDFGPRLGIAYRLTEKTVIRSGYGLIWIEQAGITTPFTIPQFPFLQTVNQRNLDNINPAFVLANGPSVAPIPLTPNAGLGQGVFSVDSGLGSGYAQQWNLAIQQEIARNLVLEVAYAGSKITHIGIPDTNLNQLTVEQLSQGSLLLQRVPNPFYGTIPRSSSLGDPTIPQAQLLKPYPRFTSVSLYRNNVGNTNYNALQAKLEKRFSRGFSFLVSYTFSKLIDDAGSVFDASILTGPVANYPVADSFNRRLERDVSTGDIPNVFVTSFVYDLPFGAGHRLDPQGVPGKLVKGWSLTGIVTFQSGLPLAVTQATNFNAFAGFGTQRPNRVADPNLPADQRSTTRFFDTSAFVVAPQSTIGTSSRNPVRGPSYQNVDLALIKQTTLHEQIILEFRIEAFNLTNMPPLNAPNVVLGTAGFGSITSAGDPRVLQFGLKLNF
ncbi:MAG: carboxypeptidase regulatory-like domain-containing protein [Terriglobia bacterium]